MTFCHALLDRHAVEVLVWVDAARREAVVSGFAQAAGLVDPGPAARTARARRRPRPASWRGCTGPGGPGPWSWTTWPTPVTCASCGQPAPRAGPRSPPDSPPAPSRPEPTRVQVIPVSGLSTAEAMEYLTARLGYGLGPRFEASDLIEDLDGLPLALAQAARSCGLRDWTAPRTAPCWPNGGRT